MRLIDAEKCPCKGCLITYCHENCKKYYAWLNGCDYDVEAKVAKLEKSEKRLMLRNGNAEKTLYIPANTAISIVRGKE